MLRQLDLSHADMRKALRQQKYLVQPRENTTMLPMLSSPETPHLDSNLARPSLLLVGGGAAVLLGDVLGAALGLGHAHHLGALVDVVGAAEEDVDLLEGDLLGLGDEEVDEEAEEDVDGHEEEQALEPFVGEEDGEELLEAARRTREELVFFLFLFFKTIRQGWKWGVLTWCLRRFASASTCQRPERGHSLRKSQRSRSR